MMHVSGMNTSSLHPGILCLHTSLQNSCENFALVCQQPLLNLSPENLDNKLRILPRCSFPHALKSPPVNECGRKRLLPQPDRQIVAESHTISAVAAVASSEFRVVRNVPDSVCEAKGNSLPNRGHEVSATFDDAALLHSGQHVASRAADGKVCDASDAVGCRVHG